MSHRFSQSLLWALMPLAIMACQAEGDESVRDVHELVIAGHPVSTQTGLDILHHGGNAADALIAVSLSLGVTEPGNSGLGGKMVLLYYDAATKTVSSIVAMSAAPLNAPGEQLKVFPSEKKEQGWTSVCVPGIASALGEIHSHWGTRPWAELCQPAIDQADKGITIIPTAAAMFKDFKPNVDAEATRLYAPGGVTLQAGAIFKNPDLARTLKIISDNGPQAFYQGEIAGRLVDASDKGGGYFSLNDFKAYHARVLQPLKGSFETYTVYSSPPPLEGGATVLSALKCMDRMDWTGASPRNPKYIDTFCRVMQQVYPDERRAAGDVPDSPQRVAKLLDEASIDKLVKTAQTADPHSPYQAKPAAALLNEPDRLADSRFNQAPMGDESEMASTTHLVIIDKMGNVACCTQSLGLHFGSQVVAAGTGVLLNADESNFSFGNAKSINAFAPGKWPRSTMSPTLFFKDDKPYLVIGSPAGARIPNLVLQVSLDVLKFGTPLKSAIEAPRFHIVAAAGKSDAPNHIDIEPEMPADLEGSLEKLGWSVKRRMQHDFYFGSVNAALIQGDRIAGVADQRRTADAGGD